MDCLDIITKLHVKTIIMKRILYALMLLLGLSIVGCEKEDRIRVTSGSSITFPGEESSGTITINSNVPWKASATASWIELSPASGESGSASITVKAKANDSADERNASVTISGGTASASVKITQKPNDVHTMIFYTSTDGKTVEPRRLTAWSADASKLEYTNTYGENGGVIEFNGIVNMIDLSYMGYYDENNTLLSFDGISNMVILSLESGNSMFCNCSSLQSIDLSNFNTKNVVDMSFMFSGCSSLKALDLRSFNTENVSDMSCMFQSCSSLQDIKAGERTNKGEINADTFRWIKSNGILYYPQGCDYSEWISVLGQYGWTGQEY